MKNVVHFLPFLLILVLAAASGLSDAQIAQTTEVINATLAAEATGTAVIQSTSQAATDAVETALAETAAVATETQLAADQKATRQANAQETLLARTQEGYGRAAEAVSEIRPIVDALYDAGHITTRDGYRKCGLKAPGFRPKDYPQVSRGGDAKRDESPRPNQANAAIHATGASSLALHPSGGQEIPRLWQPQKRRPAPSLTEDPAFLVVR